MECLRETTTRDCANRSSAPRRLVVQPSESVMWRFHITPALKFPSFLEPQLCLNQSQGLEHWVAGASSVHGH
jgi:hypothetical protein